MQISSCDDAMRKAETVRNGERKEEGRGETEESRLKDVTIIYGISFYFLSLAHRDLSVTNAFFLLILVPILWTSFFFAWRHAPLPF